MKINRKWYVTHYTFYVSIKSCQKLSKFKTKSSKKGAMGIAEYTGSYVDGSADTSYLLMPSIVSPFFDWDSQY